MLSCGISRGFTFRDNNDSCKSIRIDREGAARYSFLLATPITAVAVIFNLGKFQFTSLAFWIGILTSFIVGILIIKFLLDYLKKEAF